jgi:hypothetical protein
LTCARSVQMRGILDILFSLGREMREALGYT